MYAGQGSGTPASAVKAAAQAGLTRHLIRGIVFPQITTNITPFCPLVKDITQKDAYTRKSSIILSAAPSSVTSSRWG